jgi:thioredoxin reductase (NADPH)
MYDVIIVGAGVAGYSAAVYASRGMLKTLIISGDLIGGALTKTTEVENYTGFKSILGNDLVLKMQEHALHFGAKMVTDYVLDIKIVDNQIFENGKIGNLFKVVGRDGVYESKAVIIATGSSAKWLEVEGEEKFKGYGVSSCATCDGFFYKNKTVAVVGGGNTAVEEALYLAKIASKVILIHRRDSFRAEKIMQQKLFNTKNIEILTDTIVTKCLGDEKFLNAIEVENLKHKEINKINVDGLFVAIGYFPNTLFLNNNVIKLDLDGYIKIFDGKTATNVSGIFAAGDVAENNYRQAITSAASGAVAAMDCIKYLD